MNYVPVLQSAYASDGLDKIQTAVINNEWRNYLEKEEKGESDFTAQEIAQIKSDLKASNKILLDTYKATYETMTSYEVWASFPYENSAKIRKIFGIRPDGHKTLRTRHGKFEKRLGSFGARRTAREKWRNPFTSGRGGACRLSLRKLVQRTFRNRRRAWMTRVRLYNS